MAALAHRGIMSPRRLACSPLLVASTLIPDISPRLRLTLALFPSPSLVQRSIGLLRRHLPHLHRCRLRDRQVRCRYLGHVHPQAGLDDEVCRTRHYGRYYRHCQSSGGLSTG